MEWLVNNKRMMTQMPWGRAWRGQGWYLARRHYSWAIWVENMAHFLTICHMSNYKRFISVHVPTGWFLWSCHQSMLLAMVQLSTTVTTGDFTVALTGCIICHIVFKHPIAFMYSLYTLYSVINATFHLKLRNFTPLPHDMFRPQRAIIRCLVMLKLSHCIKYKIYKTLIYSHHV
jgi:hypothetical protein